MTGTEIVVGVDGSLAGLRAVDLAVQEAHLRGAPLRIVYATPGASPEAGAIVTDAAAHARLNGWDLAIADQIIVGDPAEVLAAQSADAALLVVGERHDGFTERLFGSVMTGVVAAATAPVLVARGEPHPGGHVVVGVSGDAAEHATLAFAFAEADLRGAALLAVHAWTHPLADRATDLLPPAYDEAAAEEEAAIVLAEALAGWCEAYPSLQVHRRVMHERTRRVLAGESARAQLIVVGRDRHGGLLCEPVGAFLAGEARCPVAVVPHQGR